MNPLMKTLAVMVLLLACQAQGATIKDLVQSTHSWDSVPLPTQNLTHPEVTIRKTVIAPGERLPWHSHPVIQGAYIASGELAIITQDGKEKRFKAGEPMVELVNTVHQSFNPGKEPTVMIVFFVSEAGQELTQQYEAPH